MALNCLLRGTSIKLRVSCLQSLARNPALPCSSVIGSSQFHHAVNSQPSLKSQKTLRKQNIIVPYLNKSIMQQVQQFSVSAKNMSNHGHDHAKLWTVERALAVGLLGVVPAAFLFPSAGLDYILAVMVVMHNHWGWEAVLVDYVRPKLFGEVVPKVVIGSLYALSAATLAGLIFFIYNDVGLVNALKMLWKL